MKPKKLIFSDKDFEELDKLIEQSEMSWERYIVWKILKEKKR